MKKIYVIKVGADYLEKCEGFEATLTDSVLKAELIPTKEMAYESLSKINLVFDDAYVCELSIQEIDNPKEFTKNGLFVIKYNDKENKYWTWDYFGKNRSISTINRESLFDNYKDCVKRIKIDHLDAKVIEIRF